MPEPVLTPDQWEALKAANLRGVGDAQLAETFGVEKNAIRQKRFQDAAWKAAIDASRTNNTGYKEPLTNSVTNGENGVEKAAETLSLAQKVASSVSESIAAVGQQNRLLALQIASKGLSRANAAELPVKDWSDVKILADITAKLTGLESGNAVQVNVITDGSGHFSEGEFPAFDVDG